MPHLLTDEQKLAVFPLSERLRAARTPALLLVGYLVAVLLVPLLPIWGQWLVAGFAVGFGFASVFWWYVIVRPERRRVASREARELSALREIRERVEADIARERKSGDAIKFGDLVKEREGVERDLDFYRRNPDLARVDLTTPKGGV